MFLYVFVLELINIFKHKDFDILSLLDDHVDTRRIACFFGHSTINVTICTMLWMLILLI